MLAILKIIHFFCLFGGGAASMGNGILMRKVMASGKPPEPLVADTMQRLGMIGLASIVLLWITGILMVLLYGAPANWTFYVKLLGAALVLGSVSLISLTAARARREGGAPDPLRMKLLSNLAAIGAAVAVIFAVIALN